MSKRINSVTATRTFRLPHTLCEQLAQYENQTAFVIAAIEEKLRRDAIKAARSKQEGAE